MLYAFNATSSEKLSVQDSAVSTRNPSGLKSPKCFVQNYSFLVLLAAKSQIKLEVSSLRKGNAVMFTVHLYGIEPRMLSIYCRNAV